jgi:hypothetical protein
MGNSLDCTLVYRSNEPDLSGLATNQELCPGHKGSSWKGNAR